MKKIMHFISLVIVFLFIGIINVKAVSLTVKNNVTNVDVGKKVTLNISDVKSGNKYSLTFDEKYFMVTNSTCGNRTQIFSNCEIELMANASLELTEPKEVTIFISELAQNDDSKSVVIKINNNKTAPVTTTTTTTKTTTAPTTTTTAQTQAIKSGNSNLKSLEIIGNDNKNVILTPEFSSSIYEYSAEVESSVKTITINAVMEDAKANIVISNNATEELIAGENNKITITVTAEDGTKKAYVVNIKRAALGVDATLKSLTIDEYPDFKFKEDKFSYTIKIDNDIKELTIGYETNTPSSKVLIKGNEDLVDGSKIKILVTAEDGTKKEYVLNVLKEDNEIVVDDAKPVTVSDKNPLIIMGLSIIAFGLIGGIIYVIKK